MGHSFARLLAVVAVAAAAVVLIIVVASSLDGSGGDQKRRSDRQTQTQAPKDATYVVEPGDTLDSISDKTGVPVDVLQQLNKDLDPQALPAGAELELR
jgi:LysM repeat protein